MNINDYRKEQLHLPEWMRDFHNQKDLFKTISGMYEAEMNKALPNYNWRDNQIFVIDFFLWFMAMHGYGLQKLRKKDVEFQDIHAAITKYMDEYRKDSMESLLKATQSDN